MAFPGRVTEHPVLGEAPPAEWVEFSFDGRPMRGRLGEPIGAALLASGVRALRRHEVDGAPRGLFCGIGHCFECRVTVDGVPGLRACLTPLRAGMCVESGPAPEGGDAGGC